MYKLNTFLIGCGVVALAAMLFKPLGLGNVAAGVGLLVLAYVVFYPRD
jgi:hypothetical protein